MALPMSLSRQRFEGRARGGMWRQTTADVVSPKFQGFMAAIAVLVVVDMEGSNQMPYDISDIGITILDLERLAGVPLGDRGRTWHHFAEHKHFCNSDYPRVFHKNAQSVLKHAYSKSKWLPRQQLRPMIQNILDKLAGRLIVVVTFDSGLERLLSKKWDFQLFDRQGFQYLVVQSDPEFGGRLKRECQLAKSQLSFEDDVVKRLGVPIMHLHNGGNDAASILHVTLSMATLTDEQWAQTRAYAESPGGLGLLRASWDLDVLKQNAACRSSLSPSTIFPSSKYHCSRSNAGDHQRFTHPASRPPTTPAARRQRLPSWKKTGVLPSPSDADHPPWRQCQHVSRQDAQVAVDDGDGLLLDQAPHQSAKEDQVTQPRKRKLENLKVSDILETLAAFAELCDDWAQIQVPAVPAPATTSWSPLLPHFEDPQTLQEVLAEGPCVPFQVLSFFL